MKIRGTAQHIADKYSQLARDSHASGDPVSAESYYQHAEHYYRLIAAAQEQFRQQYGNVPRPFDDDGDETDEETGPQGGYGQPGDRQPMGGEDFGEGGYQANPYEGRPGEGRPNEGRPNGERQQNQRFDRNDRQNRHQRFDAPRPDNRGGDRPDRGPERNDRFNGQDRQDRFERGDRPDRPYAAAERPDRGQERPQDRGQDRPQERPPERYGQERGQDRRERFGRQDQNGREMARPDRPAPRPERSEPARNGHDEVPEVEAGNLPAFLTNPSRQPITVAESAPPDNPPPATALPGVDAEMDPSGPAAVRPRRRRASPRRAEAADTRDNSNEVGGGSAAGHGDDIAE